MQHHGRFTYRMNVRSLTTTIFLVAFVLHQSVNGAAVNRPKTPNTPPSPSRLGKYQTAAVSSDAAICSDIGRDVLVEGGNAVDAAVATVFCIGLMLPHNAGVGGAFLLTMYDPKTRTARSLNAREAAPLAATEDMFNGNASLSQKGPLAVAVPGEVAGSWTAHQTYGKLPWSRLVQPSADLAQNGLVVNSALAKALQEQAEAIKREPSMSVFLNNATGEVLTEGEVYTRPDFARTLSQIAQNGSDVFYKGSIANGIVQDIQRRGGIFTPADMTNYRAEWVDPINIKLKNLDMYTIPPPGSGVLAAYMLSVLNTYVGQGAPANVSDDPLTYHRIAEAFKHAYAQRTKLGDPVYVPEVNDLVANLTSQAFVDSTRAKINDSFTSNDPEYYGAVLYAPEDHGTIHVSVVDQDGMAVGITSTVNTYFGAGFCSEQTGIILNNGMDDFSSPNLTNYFDVPPSPNNFIRPGKRPVSSMTPTVLVDSGSGKVRLVIGGAGGTRITTSVVYATIRNLWFGETMKEAIDSRRIHHQLFPMNFRPESDFPTYITAEMVTKGHNVTVDTSFAAVNGISIEADGFIYANADARKGGDVSGIDPVV